jgi:flagellar hook-associated protein 3 FlgL
MIDRVSTASAYNAVLTNLMQAEVAETTAGNQLSSNEQATDLQGYGGNSETLMALQGTTSQVTGYLNNSQSVSAQLATQDSALSGVASAATSANQAITNALAENNGTALMSTLQDALSSAVDGLNTTYNGQYLFSGGQVNTPAVSATNLSDLTAAPSISSLFNNDQRVASTQLDANTSITTGFLASDVGTPLLTALQAIEAYNQGPNGPLTGTLTSAQTTFLTSQIASLTTVQTNLNDVVAENGQAQTEVTNVQSSLTSQQTMLQGLVGNITNANLAKASTSLQQAQLAIQAAGQVFQALNASSLLNTLGAVSSVG